MESGVVQPFAHSSCINAMEVIVEEPAPVHQVPRCTVETNTIQIPVCPLSLCDQVHTANLCAKTATIEITSRQFSFALFVINISVVHMFYQKF